MGKDKLPIFYIFVLNEIYSAYTYYMDNILNYFSKNISKMVSQYFASNYRTNYQQLEEIRIRANKPLIMKFANSEYIFDYIVKTEDILESLEKICENSVYTYQNQICNGFITLKGGHRVGISGNAAIESNKIININHISSLNFRIARQVLNCSEKIIEYILNYQNNSVYNTLIVSPPGHGKTTILRDVTRKISSGFNGFIGINVGLVDERGEIAAMYKGVPQNDIGIRTDIFDNVPKAIGMKLLIRSMGPKVIIADEIGGEEDVEVINYAICSGIKGIFTAHGNSMEDLKYNPTIRRLFEINIFERVIFLENKLPSRIYIPNTRGDKIIYSKEQSYINK